jgi:Flp pilus assembly protein TadG
MIDEVLKFRPSRSRHRASMIAEMAVSLPLLLFLSFGMAEFGQYFYIRTTFEAAARDAARAAALQTAAQADPTTAATRTLALAHVTFNSSWMTIVDSSNGNATVTDVSTVPLGDVLIVTIHASYYQIPNAYRPLFQMTGIGVDNTKVITAQCQRIKE